MKYLLLLLTIATFTFAGENVTKDSLILQVGGFSSFPELLSNTPSHIDTTFHLIADKKSYSSTDPNYLLYSTRKNGRKRLFSEDLYGYTDGKEIYIRTEGPSMFSSVYRKLTVNEHYSYFTEWNTVSGLASGRGMNAPDITTMSYFIVEMKNGGKTALTKTALRKILRKEDIELYQHLLADNDANEKLIDYLKALNKRLSKK